MLNVSTSSLSIAFGRTSYSHQGEGGGEGEGRGGGRGGGERGEGRGGGGERFLTLTPLLLAM